MCTLCRESAVTAVVVCACMFVCCITCLCLTLGVCCLLCTYYACGFVSAESI